MEKPTLFDLIGILRQNYQFRYLNKQRIIDYAVNNFSRLLKGWEVYKVCEALIENYNEASTEDDLMYQAVFDYCQSRPVRRRRK